jgi:ribosomal protein L12E/L44/L45/RPP1/RPP2
VVSSNLSAIAVSISVNGDYYAIQQFLAKLEGMQRATVVSSVSIHPGQVPQPQSAAAAAAAPDPNSQWKTLGAEISASIFVSSAPATVPSAAGGATATAPAASASPSTTVNN